MKSYIWVTFAFMAWGYYEMSGGADFVPQTGDVVTAQVDAPAAAPVADKPVLATISTSNIVATPLEPSIEAKQAAALAPIEAAPVVVTEPQIAEVVAPVIEEAPSDIREIVGSRVNMRMGPGTDYDVITTLTNGTKLEVLDVNEQGWANVATVDRGVEGWMAERLLSDPET